MDYIVKQAQQLRFKVRDYSQSDNDPNYLRLERMIEDFKDHAEQDADNDKLQWKIKEIRNELNNFKRDEAIFNFQETDDMQDRCEDILQQLQKLARQ